MMWGWNGCCGGWWGGLWGLVTVLIVLGVLYLLFRSLMGASGNRSAPPPPPRDDALRILKARYARGEITREEFEQMKRDLLEP